MDEIMKRSHELREDPERHYNCAQAVFIPFAEKKGLTPEQANAIAQNFGSGMQAGLTCGAITGGLMALGLCGAGDPGIAVELMRRIGSLHEGRTQCRDLLAEEVRTPKEKKPHCDAMVYEAVEAVEEMLRERGITF
ncbi:MAG: C-GCAxxG-C-C family protein [Bilifractor sp.]|jgi:C_GCAxxG_C_C family probable redox protein